MLNKPRTLRFTTKDRLIATMQCRVGLALVVLAANMLASPNSANSFLKALFAIMGCSLVCHGICRPFGKPRGLIAAIVAAAIAFAMQTEFGVFKRTAEFEQVAAIRSQLFGSRFDRRP